MKITYEVIVASDMKIGGKEQVRVIELKTETLLAGLGALASKGVDLQKIMRITQKPPEQVKIYPAGVLPPAH